MKRNLGSGIIVLALAAFAGFLLFRDYRRSWQQGTSSVGQFIFPDLPVNKARNVIITTSNEKTLLERHNKRWQVMNLYGYPADFERLAPLVRHLPQLKVVQSFVVAPDDYGRLQLNDPSPAEANNAGLKLQVYDADDNTLAALILGQLHTNASQTPTGRYALLLQRREVVLLDSPLAQLDANPNQWLDRTFPRIGQFKLARRLKDGTPLWTMKRGEQGGVLLQAELPAGRAIDPERLDRSRDVLSRMNFTDIGSPDHKDSDWGFANRVFELADENGITYRFHLGTLTERRQLPVRIEVQFREPAFQPPSGLTDPVAIAEQKAAHAKTVNATRERFSRESELYKGWVYLLPRASYEPMLYTVEDFLLPKP